MEGRLAASPATLAPIFLGFTFHRGVSQGSSLSAGQATAQTDSVTECTCQRDRNGNSHAAEGSL
jgi:hypothetical protein